MAKMKWQRYSGTGVEGFFRYPGRQSHNAYEERQEMARFARRYWAERGEEAKKEAKRKAESKSTKSVSTNPKSKSVSKAKDRSGSKKLAAVLRAKVIGGRRIEIVVDWGLFVVTGTYTIEFLREKAITGDSVDLISSDSGENCGALTINLALLDQCINNGSLIEKLYFK